ncbi:hypothetical protein TKK_0010622 [Trichogramma kaykai]
MSTSARTARMTRCTPMTRPATYYDVCRGVGHLVDAMVQGYRPRASTGSTSTNRPISVSASDRDWTKRDIDAIRR